MAGFSAFRLELNVTDIADRTLRLTVVIHETLT